MIPRACRRLAEVDFPIAEVSRHPARESRSATATRRPCTCGGRAAPSQANGHAAALRALLKAERERGPGFLRLANALTALYPRASREKRLLDAMLLAAPRNLGGG